MLVNSQNCAKSLKLYPTPHGAHELGDVIMYNGLVHYTTCINQYKCF